MPSCTRTLLVRLGVHRTQGDTDTYAEQQPHEENSLDEILKLRVYRSLNKQRLTLLIKELRLSVS